MAYFLNNLNFKIQKYDKKIIKGFAALLQPFVGDVLRIFFSKAGSFFSFEGLCFSIFSKNFLCFDSTLDLICKLKGIYIYITFSFFANLIFAFEKIDYKKANIKLKRAKINVYKSLIL
jgi:hypothetical protein